MSCYIIYYNEGAKMMRPVTNRDEYVQLRDSAKQKAIIADIRKGNDKMKHRLLQMNYSCLPNEDGTLKGSTQMTTSVGMDIDHIAKEQMQEVKERILANKDELGLLMLELSARGEGYHLVFKRKAELSQEDNLRWASDLLGVEFDKGAKDITRVFFTTTASEEDLLFLSDELFVNESAEGATEQSTGCKPCVEDTPTNPKAPKVRHNSITQYETMSPIQGSENGYNNENDSANALSSAMPPLQGSEKGESANNNSANALSSAMPSLQDSSKHDGVLESLPIKGEMGKAQRGSLSYLGIPYASIIRKYWEMFNDGKEPCQGNRNMLTYELAMTLRGICDYDQKLMERVIPRYDNFGEEEWRKTIQNAIGEPRKGMPYRLRQVLKAVREEQKLKTISYSTECEVTDAKALISAMPQRPKKMPAFLSLISSKVPMKYKAMIEESIWPALCAHLHGVTFRYVDGVIHEANISSPLIARQSTGKGRINEPVEYLLADISARDMENDARLKDWRRRNQGKGSSKDKQPRPEDVCIQRLDDDLTPAALAQSLIDADVNGGKRIMTKVDEIEMLNKVGNGRNDTVALLVRYGFDSQRFGQRRVGLDSVNGSYTVRWVWNASCTLKSARKFFNNDWVANGSLSRLNINALLIDKDDHELPKIGVYDERFADALHPYVERLNAASGLIECPQADKVALEMIDEHNRIADLCESEGYRTYAYRAVLIGWLKAYILYIMNGYKWNWMIGDYARYSVRRDMFLKMYFFGQQIEDEFEEEERQQHAGPKNMLELLPAEFTEEQYLEIRRQCGKTGDGRGTLRKWKSRGYIIYDEVMNAWIKSKV